MYIMPDKPTCKDALCALLWDSLKSVPGQPDRRQTEWGTKTQEGLTRCIVRIMANYPHEIERLDGHRKEPKPCLTPLANPQ